jgi:hypothetical protein
MNAAEWSRRSSSREGFAVANNYVLIYHSATGGGMAPSADEQAKVMQAWNDWFGKLDGALVDGGNPATQTRTIAANGSVSDEAHGPTGYSIIKADSLDDAVRLARGCPVLQDPGASVQVVETANVM